MFFYAIILLELNEVVGVNMRKWQNILWGSCLILFGIVVISIIAPPIKAPEKLNLDTESEIDYIIIDQSKVSLTDILPAPFPNWYNEERTLSPNHPDDSYAAVKILRYPGKSLGYQNDLEWGYAQYFPKFFDLTGNGARRIREYYFNQYLKAVKNLYEYKFDDQVPDVISQSVLHFFRDWDSYILGNYLIVTWYSDWHNGGAHGGRDYGAEQFDLKTGALLTKEDIFDDWEKAKIALKPMIVKHLKEDLDWPGDADIFRDSLFVNFRLDRDGIVFIYNEYEIASYAEGAYQVLIPYQELKSILKIKI